MFYFRLGGKVTRELLCGKFNYMGFQDYLKNTALEINQELDKFFESWSEEVASTSSKLSTLNREFIQANQGGKNLRGVLVKLGYEMAGGNPNPDILKPAAAFEIFQTAVLAHKGKNGNKQN